MAIITSLVMIYDDENILLAMKKRGFGTGRWNGYGGKVLEGESVEESARRELLEESGIQATELASRGKLRFTFADDTEDIEVNLFSVSNYTGEPVETEEMKPQWFVHSEIPFSEMWADDPFWIPLLLSGKNITGQIDFDNVTDQNILNNTIREDAQ